MMHRLRLGYGGNLNRKSADAHFLLVSLGGKSEPPFRSCERKTGNCRVGCFETMSRTPHGFAQPDGSTIKKGTAKGAFFMVEPAGIEPVSENLLTEPSSQTVGLLNFPYENTDRQVFSSVALLCMVGTRANPRRMFTTHLTLGAGRRPPARNGRHVWPRHCRS